MKRKNWLRNSSFEWDFEIGRRGIQDGFALGWGLWGKGNAYGLYLDSSIPSLDRNCVDGSRAQRIDVKARGDTPVQISQDVRGVRPGQSYTFSTSMKVDAGQRLETSVTMYFIGEGKWLSAGESKWQSPIDFARVHVSGSAPEGVNRARCTVLVRPKQPGSTGTVWIDAAQFELSAGPTAYTPCYSEGSAEYVSPPMDLAKAGAPHKLAWTAALASGTDLRFQLRSADTRAGLADAEWHGPTMADAYAQFIEIGPNMLQNPSVEDLDAEGKQPGKTRTIGYGDNDRAFTVVPDAHTGERALKVEIKQHTRGNGRWEVEWDGPFEPNALYAFGLWHKEDSAAASIHMSVAVREADGSMRWGRFGQTTRASTEWKRDVITFRMPATLPKQLYFEMNLSGPGWTITDDYSLRRVAGAEEWPVNPVHRDAKWIQFRARLSTTDPAYSPKLFKTEIACGPAVPEVRWLNVTADGLDRQRYSFRRTQTAVFQPQVLEFTGIESIERVVLRVIAPSGKMVHREQMVHGDAISKTERFYRGMYRFAPDASLGEWRAIVSATNRAGKTGEETVVLKVREPYRTAPRRMTIGALVTNYGFSQYKGKALEKLIAKYRSAKGLELWLMSVQWARLEPLPGKFDPEVIEGLKTFVRAAGESGAKAQIGIQQQMFPEWVNNGDWDNTNRYHYAPTKRLAHTWGRLAMELKDVPGIESYLLINEENAIRDADAYLRAMAKVQAAVREADPDTAHRITVRPNTREPYIRTRLATDGAQDYDYGNGGYPTHSSWFYKRYASPTSQTACMRMATFHASPLVFGGPGGVGEVGFFVRKPSDRFGDPERLEGFKRAMIIAYEMGMDAFKLWGGAFSFDDTEAYYPKLVAFRDELIKRPRPSRFDARVVMETGERLYANKPRHSSVLDMAHQPYAAVFRYLDGNGYVWYYTTRQAMAIQEVSAAVTVVLARYRDKSPSEQTAMVAEALKGVQPSGTPLPWPDNED